MNTMHKHLFTTPFLERKSIVPEKKLYSIIEESFPETLDEPYTLEHLYQEIVNIPEEKRKHSNIQMRKGSIIFRNVVAGTIYKFIFEKIDTEYVFMYQCKVDKHDIPLIEWKKFKITILQLRKLMLNII